MSFSRRCLDRYLTSQDRLNLQVEMWVDGPTLKPRTGDPQWIPRPRTHFPSTMFPYWQPVLILLIILTVYSFLDKRDKRGKKYLFPPGPKGLPIVGNSFQLPPFGAGQLTKKWAEQYGEMYFLPTQF
jgi:hypothetical protein